MDFFEKILIGVVVIVFGLSVARIYYAGKVELEILELWFPFLMAVTAIAGGYEGVKTWRGTGVYGKEEGKKNRGGTI